MQYDNIYMFDILYEDKNGKDAFFKIYSDKANVYALENLPDTTYKIERRHLLKDFDGNFSFTYSMYDEDFFDDTTLDEYWVGQKLTLTDLKTEIKTATDKKYRDRLNHWYNSMTNDGDDCNTIILKLKNNHIIFVNIDPKRVVGVINGGKIVRQGLQTKQPAQTKQPPQKQSVKSKYDNDNYIDLE